MNPDHKLYSLIGGVVVLLVVASLIGRVLRMRVRDENGAAVVDNLNARVRAWWSMVAVFAAAFLLGRNATIAMFALISFFALREFLTLTPTKIGDHRALSVAFLRDDPDSISADRDELVQPVLDFHPGLWLSLSAIAVCIGARHRTFPRAQRQDSMGRDDRDLLHQPFAGVAAARHSRLCRTESAADVLSHPRRADERRHAICVRQTIRQNQDRAGGQSVENGRGLCWRRPRARR